MRKLFSILILTIALVISVPVVLGALAYQRDITSNGVTAPYDWTNRTAGLTLTFYAWTRSNVKLSVTANSSTELTNINWGNSVGVINFNYSRGYQASAYAIVALTNTGNVPVNVYLKLVSYQIAIPQTTINVFWGMAGDSGPNITLQPGQTVHPALTIAIVSNTPAYGATPFSIHVMITAVQTKGSS